MNIAITGSGSKTEYSDTLDWQIEAWVSTYTAIAKDELAAVSDDLPQLRDRKSVV